MSPFVPPEPTVPTSAPSLVRFQERPSVAEGAALGAENVAFYVSLRKCVISVRSPSPLNVGILAHWLNRSDGCCRITVAMKNDKGRRA